MREAVELLADRIGDDDEEFPTSHRCPRPDRSLVAVDVAQDRPDAASTKIGADEPSPFGTARAPPFQHRRDWARDLGREPCALRDGSIALDCPPTARRCQRRVARASFRFVQPLHPGHVLSVGELRASTVLDLQSSPAPPAFPGHPVGARERLWIRPHG